MAAVSVFTRWFVTNSPDVKHRLVSVKLLGKNIVNVYAYTSDTLDGSAGSPITLASGLSNVSEKIINATMDLVFKAKIQIKVTGDVNGSIPEIQSCVIKVKPEERLETA